jgi:HNH endonuclease
MIALENPPGSVVRIEAQKAATDNGFRLERGIENGWLHYRSTTAPGSLWIASASSQGPWLLSIDHSGVVAELGTLSAAPVLGPGLATFTFATLTQLYAALDRVYKLAVSLPDAPLTRFQAKIAGLPRTTEAERQVVQRIGQDVFRSALMDYWGGRCPLTGITDPALLRASHIIPWSECDDAQRLDVHNGLLLSALWDAAFDWGLVSFADDGTPRASPNLSQTARIALGFDAVPPLRGLRDAHRANLSLHRMRNGFRSTRGV